MNHDRVFEAAPAPAATVPPCYYEWGGAGGLAPPRGTPLNSRNLEPGDYRGDFAFYGITTGTRVYMFHAAKSLTEALLRRSKEH